MSCKDSAKRICMVAYMLLSFSVCEIVTCSVVPKTSVHMTTTGDEQNFNSAYKKFHKRKDKPLLTCLSSKVEGVGGTSRSSHTGLGEPCDVTVEQVHTTALEPLLEDHVSPQTCGPRTSCPRS